MITATIVMDNQSMEWLAKHLDRMRWKPGVGDHWPERIAPHEYNQTIDKYMDELIAHSRKPVGC